MTKSNKLMFSLLLCVFVALFMAMTGTFTGSIHIESVWPWVSNGLIEETGLLGVVMLSFVFSFFMILDFLKSKEQVGIFSRYTTGVTLLVIFSLKTLMLLIFASSGSEELKANICVFSLYFLLFINLYYILDRCLTLNQVNVLNVFTGLGVMVACVLMLFLKSTSNVLVIGLLVALMVISVMLWIWEIYFRKQRLVILSDDYSGAQSLFDKNMMGFSPKFTLPYSGQLSARHHNFISTDHDLSLTKGSWFEAVPFILVSISTDKVTELCQQEDPSMAMKSYISRIYRVVQCLKHPFKPSEIGFVITRLDQCHGYKDFQRWLYAGHQEFSLSSKESVLDKVKKVRAEVRHALIKLSPQEFTNALEFFQRYQVMFSSLDYMFRYANHRFKDQSFPIYLSAQDEVSHLKDARGPASSVWEYEKGYHRDSEGNL